MCGPCPGGVCVAFIRCLLQAHRGLVSTSLHTNLASDALKMAIWQRKRQDADFTSKVHSLPTAESSAEPFATGRPWPTARRWPRRAPSAGSYDNALVGLNSLYKAELIRNKGTWTGIDAVEIAIAQWTCWYNTACPHTPPPRDRHVHPPSSARPPGPHCHQAPTTHNHNQINHPPQNPGLTAARGPGGDPARPHPFVRSSGG